MNHFVDTHAHIYHEDFEIDRIDMLQRCSKAGIAKIYMPNVDHASIDGMLELESRSNGVCHAMMGLHPCSVKKEFERELYLVETWLSKRKFVAVGEIGTDLHWDKTFFEHQKEAFSVQVAWAKQYKIPIVIHCRESIDETIELVEKLKDDSLTGIFHCFTGNEDQAERIVKLGFYLGIGGVITFKNSGLDKVIPELDPQYMVLETDSPYLAPVPHRGKRNEPSYIPIVAEKLATLLRMPVEDLQRVTTENANRLFDHKN